jgi:hypothetical protein
MRALGSDLRHAPNEKNAPSDGSPLWPLQRAFAHGQHHWAVVTIQGIGTHLSIPTQGRNHCGDICPGDSGIISRDTLSQPTPPAARN